MYFLGTRKAFPFLIGKVLTIQSMISLIRYYFEFPFLIGKVLTMDRRSTEVMNLCNLLTVSIPYR